MGVALGRACKSLAMARFVMLAGIFFFSACRGSGGLSMKAVEIHGDSRSLLKISQRLRIL